MADELIDICDENNKVIGKEMKSKAHIEGLWHRAIHIWIYNSRGEILLQLRAKDKSLYPDRWDVSVAGHISAGEEPIISGLREANEEIGLKINKSNLIFYKIWKDKSVFNGLKNNEYNYVYFYKYDGDIHSLKLQEEELQEIKFFSENEILNGLKKDPDSFVSHGEYWFEIIDEVKKRVR